VKVLGKGIAPEQLVRYAAKLKCDYDEVWCVVDTDEYDIPLAVRAADETGVDLVVSNPCFEFWLLLHFKDHRSPAHSYGEIVPNLIKYVPDYDKCRLIFTHYAAGVEDAVQRARAIDPTGRDTAHNPCTGVWRLALSVLPDDGVAGTFPQAGYPGRRVFPRNGSPCRSAHPRLCAQRGRLRGDGRPSDR
jgi:hypothetical protein